MGAGLPELSGTNTESSKPRASTPRRWWTRRPYRILGVTIGVGLVFTFAVYWLVLSPERLAVLAANALQGMTGGRVEVAEAHVDLRSGIVRLDDVAIRAVGWEGEAGRVFHADRIVAWCQPLSMLFGPLQCQRVSIEKPTVTLAEDVSGDGNSHLRFNVQALRPPTGGPGRVSVPMVQINGAQVRFAEVDGEQFNLLGKIDVKGWVEPNATSPDTFDLSVAEVQGADAKEPGLGVTGTFSIDRGTADAQVGGLAFSPRYRQMLPSALRQWWDDLKPDGRITRVAFDLDPNDGWSAHVAFDDVAMTVPQLTESDDRFRMTGVSGAFEFNREGFQIVDQLRGTIEGLPYTIAGGSEGYDPNGPFRLAIKTGELDIPDQPRYVYALPQAVQQVFQMITPVGRMSVSLSVWRPAHGEPIDYAGTATIHSGEGRYARFPYKLENCRGIVHFSPRQIKILSLTGQTSGVGTATINGVIAPPNDEPAVDLTVTAINVPFDRALYEALDPSHRRALDMFFHEPSYERMRREGHFITLGEYNADELALRQVRRAKAGLDPNDDAARRRYEQQGKAIEQRLSQPAFDLGGRANVVVHVTRTPGPGDRTTATTEVDLHEASIVLSFFPYPMRVSEGRLIIDPNGVDFVGVEATGLHGGGASINGKVSFVRGDEALSVRPQLDVAAVNVPIDEMLFDALPQPHDQWVRRLGASGTLRIDGRVFSNDRNEPDADLAIGLNDVRLQPGGGRFVLDDVSGQIDLSLEGVALRELRGRRGRSVVKLEGGIQWSNEAGPSVQLHAAAASLDFSDPLLDLFAPFMAVDPRWEKALATYQPTGAFDAALRYETKDENADLHVAIMPSSFAATYADKRYTFQNTTGRALLHRDRVELDGLTADLGDGRLRIDGNVHLTPERRAQLSVLAAGNAITDELRQVLPDGFVKLIDAFGIDTGYDVLLDRITVHPDAAKGEDRIRMTGSALLHDGSGDLGLPVTDFNGRVDVDARVVVGHDWPVLNLEVDAERLALADRPVTQFNATFVSGEDGSMIAAPKLRGWMFDGAIGGSGTIDLARKTYGFHLALSEADLTPFMAAGERAHIAAPNEHEAERRPMTGKLSAAFSIEGHIDQPERVRARGDIQIRDAELYDLPLSLGLLQVTHLSLPTTRSFNSARISYYMQGRRITFERLSLESESMRLAGEGSMDYGTGKLDLTLTSSNPGGLNLGPITDLIDGLRNELVTIRVTGTLDEPVREVRQLSGLSQAWQDVFGGGESE